MKLQLCLRAGWLALLVSLAAAAGSQTLYVQINLEFETDLERADEIDDERGDGDRDENCSILQVDSDGTLTELVSSAQIKALTGEISANCGDTGLAVAPDGTLYFAEDVSHHILRRTPGGALSIFVDAADIDALIGETSDSDNGMDLGPDGTLFVADEDCNCIYTVSPDGNTLEVIVTEAQVGMATGNVDFGFGRGAPGACTGDEPVADLEGGLVVAPNGTIYFADDGSGCNPNRPSSDTRGFSLEDSLDAILSAVPDGLGGYDVTVVVDEDDVYQALPGSYDPAHGECSNSFAKFSLDIDLGTDGLLYVLDNGASAPPPQACNRGGELVTEDKVLQVNPGTGSITLLADGPDFGAFTGASGQDQADLEGGIAAFGSRLFVGDHGPDQRPVRGGQTSVNTIFEVSTSGAVSEYVSDEELQAFYGPMYGGQTARLSGGMDVLDAAVSVLEIPVAGGAGLATLISLLAALGAWTVRRRL